MFKVYISQQELAQGLIGWLKLSCASCVIYETRWTRLCYIQFEVWYYLIKPKIIWLLILSSTSFTADRWREFYIVSTNKKFNSFTSPQDNS